MATRAAPPVLAHHPRRRRTGAIPVLTAVRICHATLRPLTPGPVPTWVALTVLHDYGPMEVRGLARLTSFRAQLPREDEVRRSTSPRRGLRIERHHAGPRSPHLAGGADRLSQ